MIRAEELMIGSYIYRPDCYDKVVEIRSNGIIGTDSLRGLIAFSQLEPILLTPKILERNGFVIKKKLAQMGNFGNSPLIMWHFEDEPILRHFKHELEIHQNDTGKVHIHIPCEYVHELQQAMRLCKINKTIEL